MKKYKEAKLFYVSKEFSRKQAYKIAKMQGYIDTACTNDKEWEAYAGYDVVRHQLDLDRWQKKDKKFWIFFLTDTSQPNYTCAHGTPRKNIARTGYNPDCNICMELFLYQYK